MFQRFLSNFSDFLKKEMSYDNDNCTSHHMMDKLVRILCLGFRVSCFVFCVLCFVFCVLNLI
jgi:hypothetical protein